VKEESFSSFLQASPRFFDPRTFPELYFTTRKVRSPSFLILFYHSSSDFLELPFDFPYRNKYPFETPFSLFLISLLPLKCRKEKHLSLIALHFPGVCTPRGSKLSRAKASSGFSFEDKEMPPSQLALRTITEVLILV